eukprot:9169169-Prorocentrum_lima.AAC.1
MTSSLVGSEMCIRDRKWRMPRWACSWASASLEGLTGCPEACGEQRICPCLLYTSDAADDM